MNQEPRTYSGNVSDEDIKKIAAEIFKFSQEQGLLWDMFPQQNEVSKYYEIALTDEDGNGEEYWSFESEDVANKVIEQLGVLVEAENQ